MKLLFSQGKWIDILSSIHSILSSKRYYIQNFYYIFRYVISLEILIFQKQFMASVKAPGCLFVEARRILREGRVCNERCNASGRLPVRTASLISR